MADEAIVVAESLTDFCVDTAKLRNKLCNTFALKLDKNWNKSKCIPTDKVIIGVILPPF